MQIRPYRFRKFDGARRLDLYNHDTFSTVPHALPRRNAPVQTKSYTIQFMGTKAQWRVAIGVMRNGILGRIYKSAPTSIVNLMARSG